VRVDSIKCCVEPNYTELQEDKHMSSKKIPTESDRLGHIIAEVQQDRERQEKTYRGRALKMFPWICARCGREFSGKRVRELTVHHKDHNHDNNPPDGSNWELLCIYCHDDEHSRDQVAEWYGETTAATGQNPSHDNKPFANLMDLLKDKKK
jgi:5-methylcytosine-specific restriction endonuclease McrA